LVTGCELRVANCEHYLELATRNPQPAT